MVEAQGTNGGRQLHCLPDPHRTLPGEEPAVRLHINKWTNWMIPLRDLQQMEWLDGAGGPAGTPGLHTGRGGPAARGAGDTAIAPCLGTAGTAWIFENRRTGMIGLTMGIVLSALTIAMSKIP